MTTTVPASEREEKLNIKCLGGLACLLYTATAAWPAAWLLIGPLISLSVSQPIRAQQRPPTLKPL